MKFIRVEIDRKSKIPNVTIELDAPYPGGEILRCVLEDDRFVYLRCSEYGKWLGLDLKFPLPGLTEAAEEFAGSLYGDQLTPELVSQCLLWCPARTLPNIGSKLEIGFYNPQKQENYGGWWLLDSPTKYIAALGNREYELGLAQARTTPRAR